MSDKYVISFSGGEGSFGTLALAIELGLDFEVVFCDTLIEDEDLYRFKDEIASHYGIQIKTLTDGRDPWDVFADKKYIGNSRLAQCSRILKTEQMAKYMADKTDHILVLGMGVDEFERIERADANWHPVKVISLLQLHGWTYGDVQRALAKTGIPRARLYGLGFPHDNCGGFCVRAGQKQFLTLLLRMPERYEYHAMRMRTLMAQQPNLKPFLRVTLAGKLEYVTLDQFRDLYQSGQITVDPYDVGGCGCFVDDQPSLFGEVA